MSAIVSCNLSRLKEGQKVFWAMISPMRSQAARASGERRRFFSPQRKAARYRFNDAMLSSEVTPKKRCSSKTFSMGLVFF